MILWKGVKIMVEVSKVATGGTPFLNKKVVLEKKVTKVKIKTEAIQVETEFEGKKSIRLECICTTQVLDPVEVRWQMNPTTQNWMIDTFGKNTKNWIGKELEITVKQAGSASPGVYPKECSLEKIIT